MRIVNRTTCLRCEQNDDVQTNLVQTRRGGCCPIHDEAFIETLRRQAKITLGLPLTIQLANKGVRQHD